MKQFFISLFVATIVLQQAAFAQSSATVITPAAPTAATADTAAAATSTAEAPKVQPINIKYLGVYEGPNFTANGTNMHGDDTAISNRPKIQYNFTNDVNTGLEARVGTTFTKDGVVAANQTWRLYGTFKNVATYGILSLDLIPRVMLPTSTKNQDSTMLPSPELIATLNINPKNSRFSLDYTAQMLGYLYNNQSTARAVGFNKVTGITPGAASFIYLHAFEGSFQLGSKTQLTFGWFPEYVITKNLPMAQDSNEVDLGVNFDIAKGWSLNPYIGVEPVGMDPSNPAKSMEAAMVVTGTFL